MTLQDHIQVISRLAMGVSLQEAQAIQVPAASRMIGNIINRIANRGLASDLSRIGSYSSNPGYYTRQQFVKPSAFKPQGKRESVAYATANTKTQKITKPKRLTVSVNGKVIPIKKIKGFQFEERTSMYLPGGYKELRNIQGRRIDTVNLEYSGSMLKDISMQVTNKGILIGFKSQIQSIKGRALEDKFKGGKAKGAGKNKIFGASAEELKQYNKEMVDGFEALTTKALAA